MEFKKGDIFLVNFNPQKKNNEVGKIRPALIYQNDVLNSSNYPTIIVIPLTTQLIDDSLPIRLRIEAKEKLLKDSDLLLTQIRAIDKSRLMDFLCSVDSEILSMIDDNLKIVFDMS
jgi:mRNA interferase MazF